MIDLRLGNALDVLRTMADNSVDSVVCDPPYGLSFMNKHWDYDIPSVDIWAECLRVLKPGGHLLAFAGTRTQHRMACRIEDAGFEIRDMIAWVYGSGFPKSMDVSKAIDKAAGAEREVVATVKKTPSASSGCNEGWQRPWAEGKTTMDITAPATEAARQWQGWGTALKPALEPVTVARKPLIGTVAANVLTYGTGALNIDGCRVEGEKAGGSGNLTAWREMEGRADLPTPPAFDVTQGRWPANLIHDGSDEVVSLFPDSNGCGGSVPRVKITGYGDGVVGTGESQYIGGERIPFESGSGSAARFFYQAKANKKDRGEGNNHPTVKPTDLMRYLCRLVTPPGGIVLDPFMGSGSTGKAAVAEGFSFIGIEMVEDYFAIAHERITGEPYFANDLDELI